MIEQCQKRLDREFSPAEIEAGILKDLLIESDYNLVTAVSTYLEYSANFPFSWKPPKVWKDVLPQRSTKQKWGVPVLDSQVL